MSKVEGGGGGSDYAEAARTGTSTKTAAKFLSFRFLFFCWYNSCVSILFYLKLCDMKN